MKISNFKSRISNSLPRLIPWLAFAFLILAPAARAGVTESDIATLDITSTSLILKSGAPAEISLPWVLGRMALALGVVFGLMALVIWAARRYFPQNARLGRGGPVEVLTTRPLGQRRSLMLVRVQGRTLLLGVTPQSINTLTELEPESNWSDAAQEAGLPEP